jgi:aquaporin Z
MRKYATEFIGTFFLIFTIFCTVVGHKGDDGVIPPLAIGFSLMVMIYAGGHISGAHYNPAVTTAVFIRGRCDAKDVPGYMIAQVLGGLLAGFIATSIIKSDVVIKEPELFKNTMAVLVAEFLFTFALAYVVVNVATAKANAGNSFYGLAIGSTVLVGAFAVGAVSGGAFNPAVAISLAVFKVIPISQVWMHLVADFAGGAAAGLVFKALNPDDK